MIMDEKLDIKLAYAAMFEFLAAYYDRTSSEEVSALLGSMSLLADGGTADPAIWDDRLASVEKAKETGKTPQLELT